MCCVEIERALPPVDEMQVPSRIVHLPLSWNDPQAELAMRKYQELVRPDAPWCPSNIEFIRRINGLADEEDVRAHRLRCELSRARARRRLSRRAGGDAHRSAPSAGDHQIQSGPHLDAGKRRRHRRRLYVRLWHGGAGRLSAVRPHHPDVEYAGATTPVFEPGQPWLLRFFDQIRFFPVGATNCSRRAPRSRMAQYAVRIEEGEFSYADYARNSPMTRHRSRRSRRSSRRRSMPNASAGAR